MAQISLSGADRAPDPRPARTRAAILDAIERLGERGDDINVSAIVAEAGLSRSSFYSQFKDLGDVAVQLLSELVEREFSESRPEDVRIVTREDALEDLRDLIAEFSGRRYLYAAVFSSSATINSVWRVSSVITHGIVTRLQWMMPPGLCPVVAGNYFSAGLLAAIVDWLTTDQHLTQDELAEQLMRMLPAWVTHSFQTEGTSE